MRAVHILVRAVAPLALAAGAVSVMSTAAWAGPVPTAFHRPLPPPPVTVRQCRNGGGHVDHDRRDARIWHCDGGRFNGRFVRF